MKKIIRTLLIISLAFSLASCGETVPQDSNEAEMPTSASTFEGKNYQDVVTQLQSAGFTNIEMEPLGDLITGWLHDEGGVKEISCNGETDFSEGDKFVKDIKIVVRYHSYPEREAEAAESDIQDNKQVSQGTAEDKDGQMESEEEQPDAEASASEEEGSDTEGSASEKTEPDTIVPDEPEILNADNCPELAEVFNVDNIEDPIVEAFAKKYAGKTIEFDGFIFECYNHVDVSIFSGKETVRKYYYDVFPVVGNVEDGDEPLLRGASLKMKRVRGMDFPAIFATKENVHIIAKVVSYGDPYFLQLDPVSIEAR